MIEAGSVTRADAARDKRGMTPREIRAELMLRGVSIKQIAEAAGVTSGAVTQTIYQYNRNGFRGFRIQKLIALVLNKEVGDIWPDSYPS